MAKRFKTFIKVILGLAILSVAFLLMERWRGQISLAHYKRQLVASGEKLTPREVMAAPVPPEQNGAFDLKTALAKLQAGVALPNNSPPAMSLTPAGQAVVGFNETEWVENGGFRDGEWVKELITNNWEQLTLDLKKNEAALAEIQVILKRPIFDNQLDLSLGYATWILHLAPLKGLTRWLGSAAQLALREGRNSEALTFLLEEVRLPRLLAEDRIVISEWGRCTIAAIAREHTWEALQANGWTDAELKQLQDAWTELDFAQAAVRGLEGERVFYDVSAEIIRRSNDATYDALFPSWNFSLISGEPDVSSASSASETWNRQVYCRVWRFAWSHQDQRRTLEDLGFLVAHARSAATNRSLGLVQPAIASRQIENGRHNFYDRWRYPEPDSFAGLAMFISRALRAQTEQSLTLCAIALKRHSLRHGKYPATLEALVPEFLPAVPIDHMDGKPIRYKLRDDQGFTLYSVGEDGEDNGGDGSPRQASSGRQLWLRKDQVWPAPATPEEVVAWREKRLKE
jgi:hypothetical protein